MQVSLSLTPTELPHNSSSHPLVLPPLHNVQLNLWNQQLLRSLNTDLSYGRLVQKVYYRPFSTLITSNKVGRSGNMVGYLFEWWDTLHEYPIRVVLFIGDLLLHTVESLYDLQAPFDTDLITFLGHLEGFIETYFKPIPPYDTPNFPLLLQYPPSLLPTLQSNLNLVPLGSNQKYIQALP